MIPMTNDQNKAAGGEATITVTQAELAAAFTEWDRRYREEPESFMSTVRHLLEEDPESYGEGAAAFLLELLDDLKPKPKSKLKDVFVTLSFDLGTAFVGAFESIATAADRLADDLETFTFTIPTYLIEKTNRLYGEAGKARFEARCCGLKVSWTGPADTIVTGEHRISRRGATQRSRLVLLNNKGVVLSVGYPAIPRESGRLTG